jgi:hypothetical protein
LPERLCLGVRGVVIEEGGFGGVSVSGCFGSVYGDFFMVELTYIQNNMLVCEVEI